MKSRLGGGVSRGVEDKNSPQTERTQLMRYVREPTSNTKHTVSSQRKYWLYLS